MQYFQKISDTAIKAAKQGIQIISSAAEAALSSNLPKRKPDEEFHHCFLSVCNIIDELGKLPDADSPEVDNLLFESKVKYHLRVMLMLMEEESDRWFQEMNSSQHSELSPMPCFDAFLHHRVILELCDRAIRDLPRGCLPLILGTLASWIRAVKYPLLPHHTVHKPIARLISTASRFDSRHYSSTNAAPEIKQDLMNYKKRVDTGLTALIGVLWRHIVDNPLFLDFFTVIESPSSKMTSLLGDDQASPSSSSPQIQIDILQAVVGLMGKPRVGAYAKESLLVAVNMKDPRVENFILLHTNLVGNMIAMASSRYQTAWEELSQSTTNTTPKFPSQNNPPVSKQPFLSRATPGFVTGSSLQSKPSMTPHQIESKPSAIDAFIRAIRLIDAVTVASSGNNISSNSRSSFTNDYLSKTDYSLVPTSPKSKDREGSVLATALIKDYTYNFLHITIRTSIESGGEQQSYATAVLLRRLLQELSVYSLDSMLLLSTTAFLLSYHLDESKILLPSDSTQLVDQVKNNGLDKIQTVDNVSENVKSKDDSSEICNQLLSRCSSLSRQVSESSLHLIGTLLAVAPLHQSLYLIDQPPLKSTNDKLISMSSILHDYQSNSKTIDEMLQILLSLVKANHTVNDRSAKIYQYLLDIQTRPEDALFEPLDAFGHPYSIEPAYVQSAHGVLLGRLNGNISYIHSIFNSSSKNCGSALVDLLCSKLAVFESLRAEEQLAVAIVIHRILCVIGTGVAVSEDVSRTDTMLLFLVMIEDLWNQVRSHIITLTDFASRYASTRIAMMKNPGTTLGKDEIAIGNKESAIVRHALQTAVITREMLAETRGLVQAAHQLRVSALFDTTQNEILNLNDAIEGNDRLEEFSEEEQELYDCEKIFNKYGIELGPSKPVNTESNSITNNLEDEKQFLDEYEVVKKTLDELISNSV